MLKKLFPNLLKTCQISEKLLVVRDGVVNFYIMQSDSGLICIDTGWRSSAVRRNFKKLGLNIKDVSAVFLTHLHWDHSGCCGLFTEAQIYHGDSVNKKFGKLKNLVNIIKDKEIINVAGFKVKSLKTPGHTSFSTSYIVDDEMLFTGDTIALENGKVMPYCFIVNHDEMELEESIRKLAALEGMKYLLTSHNGLSRDVDHAFADWKLNDESTARGGDV